MLSVKILHQSANIVAKFLCIIFQFEDKGEERSDTRGKKRNNTQTEKKKIGGAFYIYGKGRKMFKAIPKKIQGQLSKNEEAETKKEWC